MDGSSPLTLINSNLVKSYLISPKTKNLNRLHHVTLKISSQAVESNSVEQFKVIASIANCQSFAFISNLKKKKADFLENLVNLGMGI